MDIMSSFIDTINLDPIDIVSEDSSSALQLVKTYLDGVISLSKKDGFDYGTGIDEITVDGMDANQVWWQTKIVLDGLEGDLMERIQDLKSVINSSDVSNTDDSEEEDATESEPDEVKEQDDQRSESDEGKQDDATVEVLDHLHTEEDEFQPSHGIVDDLIEEEDEVNAEEVPEDQESDRGEHGINDEFFNLEDFNRQTLQAESAADGEDDEDIDYFNDIPSEDEEEAIYYEDFFDKPESKGKRVIKTDISKVKETLDDSEYDVAIDAAKLDLFAGESGNSEDEAEEVIANKKLSTFEKQQQEIQKEIDQLEKDAVAEKKWALKGEVKAQDRPEDALLTADVEFDRTAKPVPVITAEVTESLEQMIRRRIQENTFDDLQRRLISDLSLKKSRPQSELSDQKSSKSLVELYEDDYKNIPQDAHISEELEKSHTEISDLFTNLCYKLDALSSAHFIPKPAQKSLEVRVDSAAISMEDAQPISMSSASVLAPQEIYKVERSDNSNEIRLKNGIAMSRDELTREDKNRLRRAAKRKRSKGISTQPSKKSKKDNVIETLARSKNVTIINKKGEKHDVRGHVQNTRSLSNTGDRVKL